MTPADRPGRRPKPTGATPAVANLRAWLELEGKPSQRELADALGVHEQLMYAWTSGRLRPGIEHARALELLTDGAVPLGAWADATAVAELVTVARARLDKKDAEPS